MRMIGRLPIEHLSIFHLVITTTLLPELIVELDFQVWFDTDSIDSHLSLSGEPFSDGIFEARTVGVGIEALNRTLSI